MRGITSLFLPYLNKEKSSWSLWRLNSKRKADLINKSRYPEDSVEIRFDIYIRPYRHVPISIKKFMSFT